MVDLTPINNATEYNQLAVLTVLSPLLGIIPFAEIFGALGRLLMFFLDAILLAVGLVWF